LYAASYSISGALLRVKGSAHHPVEVPRKWAITAYGNSVFSEPRERGHPATPFRGERGQYYVLALPTGIIKVWGFSGSTAEPKPVVAAKGGPPY